jgi:hypothetical protein
LSRSVFLLRVLLRIFIACFLLLLLVIAVEVIAGWHCDLEAKISNPVTRPREQQAATANIKDYLRPEDDTYLSYPEWYIVWSYQEKADYQEHNLPSGFPYFAAVRQYWNSYCCISRLIRGNYSFNFGEQAMLVVIGTSFSAEYLLKGAYENTVGRVSEWAGGDNQVQEDEYAYKVAREYADFVHIRPFYEFRFARHAKGLWNHTPLWGEHPLRKWERKIFLSVDYTIEAFYCWLIDRATHLSYGYEPTETFARVESADESISQQLTQVKMVKQLGPRAYIVDIPRYQEFTAIASALSEHSVKFLEIAGNSQIMISIQAPKSWKYSGADAQQLFSTPVLTHPEMQRVLLNCDVRSLSVLLRSLQSETVIIEHVYDY